MKSNSKSKLLLGVSVFLINIIYAQTITIKEVKGDYVKNKYVYYISKKDSFQLPTWKRLDFNRPVSIYDGTNRTIVGPNNWKDTIFSSTKWEQEYFYTIFKIKSNLSINVDLPGFDMYYVAKIQNSRIIPGNYFHIDRTDSTLQIFDKYDIPIFQLYVCRQWNSIYITGVRHGRSSIELVSFTSGNQIHMFQDKLTMSDLTLRATLKEYLDLAHASLKPFGKQIVVKEDPGFRFMKGAIPQ